MGNRKQKCTVEEEEALIAGIANLGPGKLKNILRDLQFAPSLVTCSNIDMKVSLVTSPLLHLPSGSVFYHQRCSLRKKPTTPKQKDVQLKPIQSQLLLPSHETIHEATVEAAYKVAEADNKSFLASEAVKEAKRVSKMTDDSDAILQLMKEIYEQCKEAQSKRNADKNAQEIQIRVKLEFQRAGGNWHGLQKPNKPPYSGEVYNLKPLLSRLSISSLHTLRRRSEEFEKALASSRAWS
ncbi:hypothetical protein SAY87_029011 [Trapa incisa]|uniref:Uncharacterized protein n=1 Tax=Trapa incisa TaxID=236973 RepID=A0AAN7L3X6_9MYRT|nr:hypothetical protein SAY87_029011 [Trapa incisa]